MKKELRFELVNNIDNLEKYSRQWDELILRVQGAKPTQAFAWLHAFFKTQNPGRRPWQCWFVFDDQKLVGFIPLLNRKVRKNGIVDIQTFGFPFHPLHFPPTDGVVYPGYEYVIVSLLKYIRKTQSVFPVLKVSDLPLFSSTLRASAASNSRLSSCLVESDSEAFLLVDSDFSNFVQNLDGKFRRELSRQKRNLESDYKVKYVIQINDSLPEPDITPFIKLELAGWKGRKGTAIGNSSADTEMFRLASNGYCKSNSLIQNYLYADDKLIAAQYAIRVNDIVYLWKIAYNESFARYAPGNLLQMDFIEYCCGNPAIRELNFMNDKDWLKVWNVKRRKLFSGLVAPYIPGGATLLRIMLKLFK